MANSVFIDLAGGTFSGGAFVPSADNTYDLGSTSLRWRTLYLGTAVAIGTNPATTGTVRLQNNTGIYGRDAANVTDIRLLVTDAADNVVVGALNTTCFYDSGSTLTLRPNAGAVTYAFNTTGVSPSTDNTRTVGQSALRWSNGFFTVLTEGGALAIGVTSTDGIVLQNTTAAALGAQQWSPRVRFRGNGWGTTGSASQTLDGVLELQTVQGTNPSFDLVYKTSLNGAATVNQFDLITTSTGVPSLFMGTGGSLMAGGTGQLGWNSSTQMTAPANGQMNIRNQADSAGVGLDVATDAVMKVRTRAQSAYATVDCLGLRASGAAGFNGTVAPPLTITCVNGIVTNIA